MPLFGFGLATVVAIAFWARSTQTVNKLGVGLMWGVFAAYSLGWSV